MAEEKSEAKIWVDRPDDFVIVEHTSQKYVLHPKLAEIINESDCRRLLDYGSGDGRMLKLLREDIPVDVFDISSRMLELIRRNVGKRLSNIFTNADQIPESAYDIVVLSMVMICIDNEPEFSRVLRNVRYAVQSEGKVLLAVTHPCFREHEFSDFKTSYGENRPLRYFNEGEPFTVRIEDKGGPSVEFEDYHWSLAFTVNKLIEAGLYVERMIETPDEHRHPDHNPYVSPYLVLICKPL